MLSRLTVGLLIVHLCITASVGFGNNLSIRHGVTEGSQLRFEISWDNSWNHTDVGSNRDAVWVFVKGRLPNGTWEHINLSPHTTDHTAFGDLAIDAVNDSMGVFISPEIFGSFDTPYTQVVLESTQSFSRYSLVKIFGIEMVYIPQGEFFLGDGVSISSLGDSNGEPFLVVSEGSIRNQLTIVNPNQEFQPTPLPSTIPGTYPKGYGAFYIMKYEISQGQYADFLNTLTYRQQAERTSSPPSSPIGTSAMAPAHTNNQFRNGIVISKPGVQGEQSARYGMDANTNGLMNEESDGFHRAANYLNWADLSAYLCWAGLRPITEFEFEKACRGLAQDPQPGEFAWGTPYVTNANTVANDGLPTETVTELPSGQSGLANHGNVVAIDGWGLQGPLRTGFAATSTSTRIQAGASYYGVMDLSGNVWEMVVMAANGGENFILTFGKGLLDDDGNATISSWCNPQVGNGVLYKGGAWSSTISEPGQWRDLAVSDRFYTHLRPTMRRNTSGGRGGR